jgi:hypothetical protein
MCADVPVCEIESEKTLLSGFLTVSVQSPCVFGRTLLVRLLFLPRFEASAQDRSAAYRLVV